MRSRIGQLALSALLLIASSGLTGSCATNSEGGEDRGGPEIMSLDLLLRGRAGLGPKESAREIHLQLFGRDSLASPPGTELWLRKVEIYGKAGVAERKELGAKDTYLTTVVPDGLEWSWDGTLPSDERGKLKVPADTKRYTVLVVFEYLAREHGKYRTVREERMGAFPEIPHAKSYQVQVPAPRPGDAITVLAVNGTFYADPGGYAIFDVENLEYTGGPAGRIEIYSAPDDGSNLYSGSNIVYYEFSPTAYPWHASGIVDSRYTGESSWRIGARVVIAGKASTSQGTFTGIVPATMVPLP